MDYGSTNSMSQMISAWWLLVLIWAIVWGAAVGIAAESKSWAWFAVGAFLGPLGLAFALINVTIERLHERIAGDVRGLRESQKVTIK